MLSETNKNDCSVHAVGTGLTLDSPEEVRFNTCHKKVQEDRGGELDAVTIL